MNTGRRRKKKTSVDAHASAHASALTTETLIPTRSIHRHTAFDSEYRRWTTQHLPLRSLIHSFIHSHTLPSSFIAIFGHLAPRNITSRRFAQLRSLSHGPSTRAYCSYYIPLLHSMHEIALFHSYFHNNSLLYKSTYISVGI